MFQKYCNVGPLQKVILKVKAVVAPNASNVMLSSVMETMISLVCKNYEKVDIVQLNKKSTKQKNVQNLGSPVCIYSSRVMDIAHYPVVNIGTCSRA